MSKSTLLTLAILPTLFFVHVQKIEAATSSALSMEAAGTEAQFDEADRTAEKLYDIKAASYHYFNSIGAFPANVTSLSDDGYYFGTFTTTYGTAISGSAAATNYTLTVDVLDVTTAEYLANAVYGTAAGTVVSMQYGAPSQEAVLDTVLSRVFDGDASRNTMGANLLMGGNSITGVNEVSSSIVKATSGVYDSGVRVFSTVNLPNKSHVGLGNVLNYGITNSYTGGSTSLYVSQKAVTDAYTDLMATIDGLTKGDVDLGNVQNYGITNSYTGGSTSLYVSQKALTNAYNAAITAVNNVDKADVGLGNVQNFAATNSYTGGSNSLYATQKAVTDAYNKLDAKKLDKTGKAADSDKLDGLDSSAFVRTTVKVNGHPLTGNVTVSKSDVGLGNIMNYPISNSYSGGSSSVYASQKAVTDAYNTLNANKLDKNSKAADADKLDGLDSSAFVRTTRTVNGKSLSGNINLTKGDVGLGSVANYSVTNEWNGNSGTTYVTQRAVKNAYDAAVSKISNGGGQYIELYKNSTGLEGGTVVLSKSWRGFKSIVVITGDDNQSEFYTKRFTEDEYDSVAEVASRLGRILRFNIISQNSYWWNGYFSTDTRFTTVDENARLYAIFGIE